jgi:hypothetical protein
MTEIRIATRGQWGTALLAFNVIAAIHLWIYQVVSNTDRADFHFGVFLGYVFGVVYAIAQMWLLSPRPTHRG